MLPRYGELPTSGDQMKDPKVLNGMLHLRAFPRARAGKSLLMTPSSDDPTNSSPGRDRSKPCIVPIHHSRLARSENVSTRSSSKSCPALPRAILALLGRCQRVDLPTHQAQLSRNDCPSHTAKGRSRHAGHKVPNAVAQNRPTC